MMTTEMEYEAKSLLTNEEYQTLQQWFGKKKAVTQMNDYYDTEAFMLKQQTAALRVRTKEQNATLTLKQQTEEGMVETHQSLHAEELALLNTGTLPDGAVKTAIEALLGNVPSFHHYGQLTTHRSTYPYKDGIICLDHSVYNNREDFEIEYEGTSMTQATTVLFELLQDQHIEYKPAKNKVARFFATSPYLS
ncbi:CYTH domain-containing protein [Alkalihalobacillus sp. LMS6]|uniref:CYTH domain-containing protein n=1 Tax=Alkalihalobacillus sp. LMS6 TaxID=2924034 RepID=UPI0020D03E28|nr:CYTH domain-containing protein [Alkalihalobacillus sp. LMS6]UTR05002.1 CYTH domain-containing protein [Alkalihalobacillus sp. LMS6]